MRFLKKIITSLDLVEPSLGIWYFVVEPFSPILAPLRFFTSILRFLQKFCMELRSGLGGGRSNNCKIWSDFNCFTVFALSHGTPLSWKWKTKLSSYQRKCAEAIAELVRMFKNRYPFLIRLSLSGVKNQCSMYTIAPSTVTSLPPNIILGTTQLFL